MLDSDVNYWVVGAAAAGTNDHFDEFIANGYWKLFWEKRKDPAQDAKARQIQPGDRIAIKKMVGGRHGQGRVRIRAIGIVEAVASNESHVQLKVNWLHAGPDRIVQGHGLFQSVHGPYRHDAPVVQAVFLELDTDPSPSALLEDVRAIERQAGNDKTTKQTLIDARLGQGKFRSEVLEHWGNRCAVTGSCVLQAVRASHIRPWRDSSNKERLDPANGLPLAAHLDALFDAGLISFDDSGDCIVSPLLTQAERRIYGLSNCKLRERPADRTLAYLQVHRTKVFRDKP